MSPLSDEKLRRARKAVQEQLSKDDEAQKAFDALVADHERARIEATNLQRQLNEAWGVVRSA